MNITVETITPEVAMELLLTNTRNRPLNKRHILFLSEQMEKGLWQMAGDPIRISITGVLLDGQHRLNAIFESQTTQQMVVVRDLPDETFHVMDTGRMRLAADVLSIGGHPNSRLLASIVRMVISYQRGNFYNTLDNAGRVAGISVTNGEIDEFASKHDMQPYVLQAKIWYKNWRMFTGSEYGFFYYTLSQVDQAAAFEFFSTLVLGADLGVDMPIFQLRRQLEKYKIGPRPIILTATQRLGLVMKTWNLYRNGKTASYISFNKDKEEVPTPI